MREALGSRCWANSVEYRMWSTMWLRIRQQPSAEWVIKTLIKLWSGRKKISPFPSTLSMYVEEWTLFWQISDKLATIAINEQRTIVEWCLMWSIDTEFISCCAIFGVKSFAEKFSSSHNSRHRPSLLFLFFSFCTLFPLPTIRHWRSSGVWDWRLWNEISSCTRDSIRFWSCETLFSLLCPMLVIEATWGKSKKSSKINAAFKLWIVKINFACCRRYLQSACAAEHTVYPIHASFSPNWPEPSCCQLIVLHSLLFLFDRNANSPILGSNYNHCREMKDTFAVLIRPNLLSLWESL